MKKTVLVSVAAALLGAALAQTALAVPPGWEPREPLPREPTYGIWKATVRYLAPHWSPDGTYHTWKYHHISANSMANCQSELQNWAGGLNTQVVEFCYWAGI